MRVLSLQPFYGGSHRQFNDGWVNSSRFEWTTLGLPARHWKWRMRHACLHFTSEITRRVKSGQSWDVIVCSDMLGVAELKGLLPAPVYRIPIVLYFHENQFEYPNQSDLDRDQHFAFTNFTSAVAADSIWFNSQYNFDSFISGLSTQAGHWPDFVPSAAIDSLQEKAKIQPPGVENLPWAFENEQSRKRNCTASRPLQLVWAARWEHDKNPEDLLATLNLLRQRNTDFRISVIGESFRNVPAAFEEIKLQFADSIEHWGYQQTRDDYWNVLKQADVFISTANHEFFGIAAAEAIVAGCYPLLPNRLAYPELLKRAIDGAAVNKFLYDGSFNNLADRIFQLSRGTDCSDGNGVYPLLSQRLAEKLNWNRRAQEMDAELDAIVSTALS